MVSLCKCISLYLFCSINLAIWVLWCKAITSDSEGPLYRTLMIFKYGSNYNIHKKLIHMHCSLLASLLLSNIGMRSEKAMALAYTNLIDNSIIHTQYIYIFQILMNKVPLFHHRSSSLKCYLSNYYHFVSTKANQKVKCHEPNFLF